MANLIDKTYFVLELDLPVNNVNVEPALNLFITQYQKDFLIGIFGSKVLHDAFIAGLAANNQIYKDILDGKDNYLGLVDSAAKRSPIANFVYYWWLRKENSQNVGIGVVKTKGENSSKASPNEKLFRAMFIVREWYANFYEFMTNNADVYPEFDKKKSYQFFDDYINGINTFNI